jgi:elongation factor Ts
MELTVNGKKVAELYNDLLAKVGEKVEIRRFSIVDSADGYVSAYTHLGNKIGVLVELVGGGPEMASGSGRDVAMQVAAMNPLVISRDQLDRSLIERELDIYKTQAVNEGKPAQIVEKIALGRLEKYYQEVALLEQTFIKDSGKTIKDYLGESGKAAGQPISIKRFQRFHLGEETK